MNKNNVPAEDAVDRLPVLTFPRARIRVVGGACELQPLRTNILEDQEEKAVRRSWVTLTEP